MTAGNAILIVASVTGLGLIGAPGSFLSWKRVPVIERSGSPEDRGDGGEGDPGRI